MSPRPGRFNQVLSIIKTLVWVVIAVAMVKFAFFPSKATDETMSLDPSAQYGQMTVLPERADITNTVKLEGTIQADDPSNAKATLDGQVTLVYVGDGAVVSQGDPIIEIRKEMPGEDQRVTDAEGNVTVIPGSSWYKYDTVYAPTSGTISINVLVGQQFAIGDNVASIQPPSFSASASLSADQMYRVQNLPATATITVKNGPAPFECTNLRIITPKTQQGSSAETSTSSTSSNGSQIRAVCAIPAEQQVFSGLQVAMELVAGSSQGALTLPLSAVEGRFETGFVYVPTADPANPEKVAVKLGLSDGRRVEIVEGIAETQEVLEFIPNKKQEELDREQMSYMTEEELGVEAGTEEAE